MLFKYILIDEICANIRLWRGFLFCGRFFFVKLALFQGEQLCLAVFVRN